MNATQAKRKMQVFRSVLSAVEESLTFPRPKKTAGLVRIAMQNGRHYRITRAEVLDALLTTPFQLSMLHPAYLSK